MMGRLKHDQGQFFYSFRLDEAVPGDHPIRQIASVLDLSWVHLELTPFYPNVPHSRNRLSFIASRMTAKASAPTLPCGVM